MIRQSFRGRRLFRVLCAAGLALLPATASGRPAAGGHAPVAELLRFFDERASGDGDGRVEATDLRPEALVAKVRRGPAADGPAIWDAYAALCRAVGGTCAATPAALTVHDVARLRDALIVSGHVVEERFDDEPAVVLGDSLTAGWIAGSEGSRTTYPAAATPVLVALGYELAEIDRLGHGRAFPFDGGAFEGLARWADYLDANVTLARSVLGASSAAVGERPARALVIGIAAGTLTGALLPWARLPEATESMTRRAMQGALGDRSPVEYAMARWTSPCPGAPVPAGGFLAVAKLSNDLLAISKGLVAAPGPTARRIEDDLDALDRRTAALKGRGVRRVFLAPPDVTRIYYELPPGTRYADGPPVPAGSRALHPWVRAAARERVVPRHVVFEPAEMAEFRALSNAARALVHEVLEVRSNWFVIDNAVEMERVTKKIDDPGLDVPVSVYRHFRYQGPDAWLSGDGEHPTRFGYALLAEAILQALVDARIHVGHGGLPEGAWRPVVGDDEAAAGLREQLILERVAYRVASAPDAYRPHAWSRHGRASTSASPMTRLTKPGASLDAGLWAWLPLEAIASLEQSAKLPWITGVGHAERTGRLLDEIATWSKAARDRWEADTFRPTAEAWLEQVETDLLRRERFFRLFADEMHGRAARPSTEGHEPWLLRDPTLELGVGTALSDRGPAFRAAVEGALPSAAAFLPVWPVDFVQLALVAGIEADKSSDAWWLTGLPGVQARLFVDALPRLETRLGAHWAPRYEGGAFELRRARLAASVHLDFWGDPAFRARALALTFSGAFEPGPSPTVSGGLGLRVSFGD